jgi:hypothetical protein
MTPLHFRLEFGSTYCYLSVARNGAWRHDMECPWFGNPPT